MMDCLEYALYYGLKHKHYQTDIVLRLKLNSFA